jgi:phenol 2-monooxygenase
MLTPNTGAFWVLVFAGEPFHTHAELAKLRAHIDGANSFAHWMHPDAIHYMTIVCGNKTQGNAALGVNSFGKFYYDPDSSVHTRYGFTAENGGVAVVRPDGILGTAVRIAKRNTVESRLTNGPGKS